MATAVKAASAGMTGAVRSLQWTIQDMNGSVEHLGQSHDHLRRAQNIMAWTTAIFGALLLSGLVWIANDIFHLKDQLMESDRRFDAVDAQMGALGSRMDDLNIAIEQLGAELLAAPASRAPVTGPDVSVLSTPNTPENFQAAANAPAVNPPVAAVNPPAETAALDAAAQPQVPVQQAPAQPVQQAPAQPAQQAALAPAQAAAPAEAAATRAPVPAFAPSPPAPRQQLTAEELAAPAPILSAAAPAAQQEAAPSGAAQTQVAEAPAAPAAAAAAAAAANLSDDQLLSFKDDQIDPADELLLLDENGNPQ